MAYRVNGLPPFQVSFSITFPEGYVGKNKLDTSFQADGFVLFCVSSVLGVARNAVLMLQSRHYNLLHTLKLGIHPRLLQEPPASL